MTNIVTPTSIDIKEFDNIKTEIEISLTNALGKINLLAPSVFAQIVAIFTERETLLWQLLEDVYNSMYPDTAEDESLDGSCALVGVTRLPATYTTVLCQLTAINYTTVPAGSEVLVENTANIFVLDDDVTISSDNCYALQLQVNDDADGLYIITVNNTAYSYESIGKTADAIATNLAALINNDTLATAVVSNDIINITALSVTSSFSCKITEQINIINVTCQADFTSVVTGVINATQYTVNQIQTPVQGWISVNNLNSGVTGRIIETDEQLRIRRNESLNLGGRGTISAIKANLVALTGVTSVTIIENATNSIDSSNRPAHSFETLVLGGSDLDIANTIWQTKPAGVLTYGNTTMNITDSSGNTQIVSFSRSTNLFIYVNITLTVNANFLSTSVQAIQDNVVAQVNSLGVGNDVVYQSLFAAVYSVAGITNAIITIGSNTVEVIPNNFVAANITVDSSSIATTDVTKIVITTISA